MSYETPHTDLCPPDATRLSYTLLRHIGLMLDELSAQGRGMVGCGVGLELALAWSGHPI